MEQPILQDWPVHFFGIKAAEIVSFHDSRDAPAGLSCSNWFNYVDVFPLAVPIHNVQTNIVLSQPEHNCLCLSAFHRMVHFQLASERHGPRYVPPPPRFNLINKLSVFPQPQRHSSKHDDARLLLLLQLLSVWLRCTAWDHHFLCFLVFNKRGFGTRRQPAATPAFLFLKTLSEWVSL